MSKNNCKNNAKINGMVLSKFGENGIRRILGNTDFVKFLWILAKTEFGKSRISRKWNFAKSEFGKCFFDKFCFRQVSLLPKITAQIISI